MPQDRKQAKSSVTAPQNRWLWFVILCSVALLFSFNNCSEVQTTQVDRTELDDQFLGKSYYSNTPLQGRLVLGLEDLTVLDFQASADGESLLLEAIENQPSDIRESGLVKTFVHNSSGLLDICDNLMAQRLESDCRAGAISADGELALFTSQDSLLGTEDRDSGHDIFQVKLPTLEKSVFKGDVTSDDFEGDISEVLISRDLKKLVFVTKNWSSQNEDNDIQQIFVKVQGERAVRVLSSSRTGEPANGDSWGANLSADGQLLLFHSNATNLLPEVTDGSDHIYLKSLTTGQLLWIDEPMMGSVARQDTHSFDGRISPDGRYVVFSSEAENLVGEDRNGFADVFLKDLKTEIIELVSKTPAGMSSKADCLKPQVSRGARLISFVCDPLAFGLARDLSSPELMIVDRSTSRWKPLDFPFTEPVSVVKSYLSDDGRQAVIGVRDAASAGPEVPMFLVRYTFWENN